MSDERPAPLVWVDMEMSGLDPVSCSVLEIAVIITDGDLNELAEGPDIVIDQPDPVLDDMDEWNTGHHGASGLTERVRQSSVSIADAERAVVAFLEEHTQRGASPLCGNSVHLDRAFLATHMPAVHDYLHYRNIDVSTLKELVRRWYPEVPIPQKQEAHRALSDIRESLAELRYYRERVFRENPVAES
ncbi:MAG: oligoribonuclease [Dehalococcoidia bacterium]|nr:oligoribonuclease [Dehalococcoidia bacterium]